MSFAKSLFVTNNSSLDVSYVSIMIESLHTIPYLSTQPVLSVVIFDDTHEHEKIFVGVPIVCRKRIQEVYVLSSYV